MAKTTTNLALPYPETTDSDNVPSDMKALADAVDVAKFTSRNLKPAMANSAGSTALSLSESFQTIDKKSVVLPGGAGSTKLIVVGSVAVASPPTSWQARLAVNSGEELSAGQAMSPVIPTGVSVAPPILGILSLGGVLSDEPLEVELQVKRVSGSGGSVVAGNHGLLAVLFAA